MTKYDGICHPERARLLNKKMDGKADRQHLKDAACQLFCFLEAGEPSPCFLDYFFIFVCYGYFDIWDGFVIL